MRRQAMQWVHVDEGQPALGDRVVVFNGVHLWLTGWKPGLMRSDVKHPVTHWARPVGLPYELLYAAVDADQECYSEAKAVAAAERRAKRRVAA